MKPPDPKYPNVPDVYGTTTPGTPTEGAKPNMPIRPTNKISVVFLCLNLPAPSNVTTAWVYSTLDLPEAMDWGPFLEGITAHTDTQGATTTHEWKVVVYTSIDGRNWSNPIDLFTAIAAGSGYAIQTEYTTTSNFGLKMRFAIASRTSSAGGIQSATVTCALAFRFKS